LYAHADAEMPAFTGFSQLERLEIAGKAPGGSAGALDPTDRACGCDRFTAVKRTVLALFSLLALMAVAAPAALAENGVGLAGPTTDKTVTFFCFGVIAFFVVLVVVMSLIQGKLEKRKDQRRSDLQRLS
jgi:hypothetical protein